MIKKLQNLIGQLSYNQSNMNLEEMVRFLSNTQAAYNQLLAGYVGVFYIIRKCQYKTMCFDCAQVTGQLQKLMIETIYTHNIDELSDVHLSNRTILFLKTKLIKKKTNHTMNGSNKLKKKMKPKVKHKNHKSFNSTTFYLDQSKALNLTEMLKINKKLRHLIMRRLGT